MIQSSLYETFWFPYIIVAMMVKKSLLELRNVIIEERKNNISKTNKEQVVLTRNPHDSEPGSAISLSQGYFTALKMQSEQLFRHIVVLVYFIATCFLQNYINGSSWFWSLILHGSIYWFYTYCYEQVKVHLNELPELVDRVEVLYDRLFKKLRHICYNIMSHISVNNITKFFDFAKSATGVTSSKNNGSNEKKVESKKN